MRYFIIFSLIIAITPLTWAANKEIDRFNSSILTNWSGSATKVSSREQIAAPDDSGTLNYYSMKITGNGSAIYTYPNPGDDWLTPDYNDIGFFVYGNGGITTLSVKVTEYDNLSGVLEVPETWTAATYSIDWIGWRYIRVDIDDTGTSSGGDGIWNPDIKNDSLPGDYRGIKTIELIVSNNIGIIYIDEIYASGDGDGITVELIHPTDDVENNNVDIVIDRMPPTISATLFNADENNTEIDVVNETNPRQRLNSTIENDGVRGVFATPDTLISSDNTYTVFVWPNVRNGSLNLGEAEVIRFSVKEPGKKISTSYNLFITD